MARMKDIAEKAGASISAVSFVLNGKADKMRISQETQERILAAAQELGYVANIQARRLRASAFIPTIVLSWPAYIKDIPLLRFMDGLAEYQKRYQSMVDIVLQPYTERAFSQEYILWVEKNYNAAIFFGLQEQERSLVEEHDFEIPVCMLGWQSEKHAYVAADAYDAGYDTAKLFAAHGLTRIGFVGDTSRDINVLNGFNKGCQESKIEFDANMVWDMPHTPYGGIRAAEEIVAKIDKQEAIMFASDEAAIGAMQLLESRKIDVPARMKIVAQGNNHLSEYLIPSLTTVWAPMDEMLLYALELLRNKMQGTMQESKLYKMEFAYRDSCAAAPGTKAYRIFI